MPNMKSCRILKTSSQKIKAVLLCKTSVLVQVLNSQCFLLHGLQGHSSFATVAFCQERLADGEAVTGLRGTRNSVGRAGVVCITALPLAQLSAPPQAQAVL